MTTTLNEFVDTQEEFWKVVSERYAESEITEFRTFFNPLFYLPDDMEVTNDAHPINVYGGDRATSENVDKLRQKIVDDCTVAYPDTLLRYMFEEEDHPIYEAVLAMIRKYRDLGNTLRNE